MKKKRGNEKRFHGCNKRTPCLKSVSALTILLRVPSFRCPLPVVWLHFFLSPRPYMDMVFPYKSEADLKVHYMVVENENKYAMQRERWGYANMDSEITFDRNIIFIL